MTCPMVVKVPKLFKESEVKKWKDLHDKGFSIIEIAKQVHVFGGTISKKIKELEAKQNPVKEEAEVKEKPVKEEASAEETIPAEEPSIFGKKKSEGGKLVAQPVGRISEDERIEAKKSLRFDPDMLKIAEWTVGNKLAADLSGAIRAWGKDYYYRHSDTVEGDGGGMQKVPQKMENDGDMDFGSIIRMMKQKVAMQTMATMSNEKGGDGLDMNKLIALSFLERQYKGKETSNNGVNPQIETLQAELRSMRDSQMQQAQMQKFESMFQGLQNQITAASQNKGGDWKEIMALSEKGKIELEKIRADHDNKMEEQRAKAEAAKEETSQVRFENLQSDVKTQMVQAAGANKWKDEVTTKYMTQAMKILDDQYTKGAKAVSGEKTTGELAKDFVTDFIGQIKAPILEPMGRALADKMAAPTPGLSPQQAQVIQQAQEKFKQSQQQQQNLVEGAELKKSPYDVMD